MDSFVTPYGRLAYFEAAKVGEDGYRKTALFLPKNEEAMASLVEQGLSKEIVKTNVSDVKKLIDDVCATVKEDGKHPTFNPKKMFKCGDKKADDALDNFMQNPENEGKETPAWCESSRNFWVVNVKTKFDIEWYGPKKSEGVRDDTWADDSMYSGCWARLILKPNAFNFQGNKGYNLYLGKWIQKWADDTNWDGGSSEPAAEVEDAVEFVPKASASDYID